MPQSIQPMAKAETFESKENAAAAKTESGIKEEFASTMAVDAAEATNPSTSKEVIESTVKALEATAAENPSGSNEQLGAAVQAQQVQTNVVHFTAFPNEVKLQILENLDPVSSACLGVACKAFYPVYRAKYGTVKLSTTKYGEPGTYKKGGNTLANSLISWVPQEIQNYNYKAGVFATKEKFKKLVKKWYKRESIYFWELHFPGHYPEGEDDYQIRTPYLNALKEHGMVYEDWPHVDDFTDDCLRNFMGDWLGLCERKHWDPLSAAHDGAKWLLINGEANYDDYDAFSATSDEADDEHEDSDEDDDSDEHEDSDEDDDSDEDEDSGEDDDSGEDEEITA